MAKEFVLIDAEGCGECCFYDLCDVMSGTKMWEVAKEQGWKELWSICGGNNVILWVPLKRISKKRF